MATRIGLDSFSPPQLTALRFLIAAAPAFILPRPPLAWPVLVAIGATLFAGQFLLQFFAIAHGLPPGLASLLVQTQALFTILFAVVAFRETPTRRQLSGVAVAFAGLVLILFTVGHDLTAVGFFLALGSAISWGVGNILLKHTEDVDMLGLIVWLSLVPPVPALALSLVLDGPFALAGAIVDATWLALAATLYLGLVGTILAYAIWGHLLRRYPAATVAPFALLVPFVGGFASLLVFGERFGALRLIGMALVLIGIAVIVLPGSLLAWRQMRIARDEDDAEEGPELSMWPATRDDARGVIDLIGRVYAEYRFVYDPRVEVPDLLRFEEHYEAPRGAFFVVREGDRDRRLGRRRAGRRRDRRAPPALSRRAAARPRHRPGPRPGRAGLVPRRAGRHAPDPLVGHPLRAGAPALHAHGLPPHRRADAPGRPQPDARVRLRAPV